MIDLRKNDTLKKSFTCFVECLKFAASAVMVVSFVIAVNFI